MNAKKQNTPGGVYANGSLAQIEEQDSIDARHPDNSLVVFSGDDSLTKPITEQNGCQVSVAEGTLSSDEDVYYSDSDTEPQAEVQSKAPLKQLGQPAASRLK